MKIIHSAPPLLLLGRSAAFLGIAPNRLKPLLANKSLPASNFIALHMSIVSEEKREETSASSANYPIQSDLSSLSSLNVFEELGFKEEQIALGIDPQEVLQWLGTREDLIAKLIEDNSNKIDRTKAEQEVDKLIGDYETVVRFINYKKWATENPEAATKVAELAAKEGKINFQEISYYALWIAAGIGLSYFSKIIRGMWEASHPEVPNIEG